jgi:hypothetical protein
MVMTRLTSRVRSGHWGRVHPVGGVTAQAALLLMIALWVLLRPLAEASPPDPTWISGVYDDDDFDDVVIQIGLQASVVDAHGPPLRGPDYYVRGLVLPSERPLFCVRRLTLQDRAPPLHCA